MRMVLVLGLVLGCGGGKAAAPTAAAPANASSSTADPRAACADAVAKAGTTGRGTDPVSPEDAARFAAMEAAMTDSCVEAQWSPAAISCFTNGKTQDELRGCTQLLTEAQNEEVQFRLGEAAKAAGEGPTEPPAPTP
ncbi:MAG: hypothetical protein JWP01_444 [Myxococcales bacterium]|nr:hypothetical protein [Myxococcales bacterium]